MRNFLEFVLISLVQHPDDVQVEETQQDNHFTYTIHVHPEDVGRIIGRQGRIIEAIRSLLRVRAVKDNVTTTVRVASDVDEQLS